MTVKTIKTGPGKFTIGETPTILEQQVRSITLEPSVDSEDDVPVLSGETAAGADTTTWAISGTMLADFGDTDSIQEFCFENRGDVLPFVFTPLNTAGKEFTGNLKVRAVSFGGDVGATSEVDFEFPVVGDPILGVSTP